MDLQEQAKEQAKKGLECPAVITNGEKKREADGEGSTRPDSGKTAFGGINRY